MTHSMEWLTPKHLARWRTFYIAKSSGGEPLQLTGLVDRMLGTFLYEKTACARQALQDLTTFLQLLSDERDRLEQTLHGTRDDATILVMPYSGQQFVLEGQDEALPCHGLVEPLEEPLRCLEDLLTYRRDVLTHIQRVERALRVHRWRLEEARSAFATQRPALVHAMLSHIADLLGEANTLMVAREPGADAAAVVVSAAAEPAPVGAVNPQNPEKAAPAALVGWRGASVRLLNQVIARIASPASR